MATIKKNPTIYDTIIVQPINRNINDIGKWKTALKAADYGKRQMLYDLYDDVMLDGTLSDAIDKRIDAVKDADLAFTIDNKDVDQMYDLMDTIEFEDLIEEIMMSKFWGISVSEFFFHPDGTFSFDSIPRKHIRPKIKQIVRQQTDETGISYENDMNIIQWGAKDDLGLLLKVAPIEIYKRGGFGDWAQFTELFGMPRRIGKYNSYDTKSRDELTHALSLSGSAAYMVIPEGTDVTTDDKGTVNNGTVFKEFRQACIEEMLITILGQTMTSIDGSSLAQGQVHMEVQEKKHKADRRFVERMLNRFFVPLLIQRGYPVSGGKFKFLDNKRELLVSEIVQLSDIMPIPQSYLHEKYNIPLPQADEPIARRSNAQVDDFNVDDDDSEENDTPKNEKKNIKNIDRVLSFFVQARRNRWASDLLSLKDDNLNDRIIRQVINENGKAYFNAELFHFTVQKLSKALHKGFSDKKLTDKSFVYNATDEAYITAMEQNLFHFSASKTLAEMNELNRIFRDSQGFDDFYKKATQTTDIFNKTWLETEYHTAVSIAESTSDYRRLIRKKNLFPFWEYKTVGDDRVREEHRKLHGVILPVDDPLWDKIYPPNGWNCRCTVAPRMKIEVAGIDIEQMRARCNDFFDSPEWIRNQAQGFGINRAVESQLFNENQMYIHKFPDQASKVIEKITPREWGVNPSFDTLMKEAERNVSIFNGTPGEWFETNKSISNGKELLQIKDYAGRTLSMEKKTFTTYTSDWGNTQFLDEIREIASNPDEVWLGREQNDKINKVKAINNYIMVKFYKNRALAVVARLEKSQLTLKTWYQVKTSEVRRGMLIRKN